MTSADLLAAIRADPFVSFRMHMESGRIVTVDRPHQIAHIPGGRFATVIGDDDAIEVVELPAVVRVEFWRRDGKHETRDYR